MYESISDRAHSMVCALIVCAVFAAGAPLPAFAQESHDFKIDNADAASAVREFGVQSRMQVVVSARALEGRSLNAVFGSLSTDQALTKLLNGSGLTYHYVAYRTVAMFPAANSKSDATQQESPAAPRTSADQTGVAGATPKTASAEQAAATSPGQLEEIIVTAQKRSENLMSIPTAISALTAETLQSRGIDGTQALQMAVPSLVYPNTGPYAQPYIRGIGSRLLQNGLDPSVATYSDGRYISRQSAVIFDFVDVDHVEVLEGPQGVLFGRNASAGAIRVISRPVSKEFEGSATASYGNFDAWSVSGVVNIPLGETFGMRVSAITTERNGYADNLVSGGLHDWNDKDLQAVRAKFRWDPVDDIDAQLTLNYWTRNDQDGNAYVALPPLQYSTGIARGGITGVGPEQVATQLKNKIRIENPSSELDVSFHFPQFDLKSITTQSHLHNHLPIDGDGTSATLVDALVFEDTNTYTQEFNLVSRNDARLEWLLGGYYLYDDTGFDTTLNTGAPQIVSTGLQAVTTRSLAAFAQLKLHLTKNFALIGGGRYSHETKAARVLASPNLNSLTTVATPFFDNVVFNKFTPVATAQYSIGDAIVYATFTEGFKRGGFNYPAVGQAPLKPELLKMYELGFKGDAFDHTVRTTLSAYYYDYSNLQVTTAAAAGVGAIVVTRNAASANAYGLDADLTWKVTRSLTLTGAFSAQHSEYKDFLADAKVFRGVVLGNTAPGMVDVGYRADGQPLLRAPKFSASASAVYDFPIGAARMPLSISYAYKGSFNFDFVADPTSGALRQRGYSVVDGKLSYEPPSDKWTASLWVNNLTNTIYFNDVVAAGTGIRGQYSAPRTYGAEFQYRF